MDERIYELDKKGDVVFLLYDVPHALLQSLDEATDGPVKLTQEDSKAGNAEDDTSTPTLLRIRASSRHLTLACAQMERTLSSGFSEDKQLHSTGSVELEVENWDAATFLLLMMIIHGRTRAVPRRVSLENLVQMALLVDYYECYEVVEVFAEMWMDALKRKPLTIVTDAESWLFVAWVFQQREMFASACVCLQKRLQGRFETLLPIPRRVQDAVNNGRETAIEETIDLLHSRLTGLQSDVFQCSYECDCALLGALAKHLQRLSLLPRPDAPFSGIGYEQLLMSGPNVSLPRWFDLSRGMEHSCLVTLGFNQSLRQTPNYQGKFDLRDFTQLRRKE